MTQTHFTYVGPPGLHDGHVVAVERAGDSARVQVRTADGKSIALEFLGVTELSSIRPEGMLLHGLAELRADAPAPPRQFIFANSEEWDTAGLEIVAREFRVLGETADDQEHP